MLAGLTSGLPAVQKTIRSRAVRDSHSCRQHPEDDRVWEAHIAKSLHRWPRMFNASCSFHLETSHPSTVRPPCMLDGSVIIPVFIHVCIPLRRVTWGISSHFPPRSLTTESQTNCPSDLARASQQTCNRPDHNPSYKRARSTVGRAFEDCWTTSRKRHVSTFLSMKGADFKGCDKTNYLARPRVEDRPNDWYSCRL